MTIALWIVAFLAFAFGCWWVGRRIAALEADVEAWERRAGVLMSHNRILMAQNHGLMEQTLRFMAEIRQRAKGPPTDERFDWLAGTGVP